MTRGEIYESLLIALDGIRSRKMRSFLTVLGVIIGVTSVIAVAAIIEGLNRNIMSRIQALGAKTFFISRIPLARLGRLPAEIRVRKYLTFDDARVIREACPTVDIATAFATRAVFFGDSNELRYEDQEVDNSIVRGVDADYAAAIPIFEVAQGRFISSYDMDHARYVAVIGLGIAGSLFPNVDPIGKVMRLNGLPFEVVGVFERDTGFFGGPGVDSFVCIPYSTFHKLYPEIKEHFIAVSVRDSKDLPAAADEVVSALRRRRHVAPQAKNDFEVTMPDFLSDLWNQLTGALVILTGVISSIALLVGGIGVMNIMLISVTERTAEIGIRKAVGARRNDIRAQFLIEAVTLTSVGGVLGILIGAAISWTVRALAPALPTYVSMFWVMMGFAIAAGVGLFFGFYPANRAAKLDPIVCLRHE
ncbi:MAG TPA: ABC transporter permease [Bryobacterales bacterium]|nr:ABC transporter permease [Bryobacterales bacterium]